MCLHSAGAPHRLHVLPERRGLASDALRRVRGGEPNTLTHELLATSPLWPMGMATKQMAQGLTHRGVERQVADRVLRRWHRRITDYLHQTWRRHRKRVQAAERLSDAETETARSNRRRSELKLLNAGRRPTARVRRPRARDKVFRSAPQDDGGASQRRQAEMMLRSVTLLSSPAFGGPPLLWIP